MSHFFISRPIFAWVIAILISIAGIIAIPKLPVERFPSVAPPSIGLYLSYPGASPKTINDSVVSLIEREITGIKGLLYFKSSSDASGSASITVTFENGTDPEMAQVEIQNKIKTIEPRLPLAVRQAGITVETTSSNNLMYLGLISPNGQYSELELSDYMLRNVVEEIKRVPGVGRIQMYGAEFAMRIWVDPIALTGYNLTMEDVTLAISQQNIQISPGKLGASPTTDGQMTVFPLTAQGQLETPEEFRQIVLRANIHGGTVLLEDVAKVELGAQNYLFSNRENGQASTSAAIQLSPGANAIATSDEIRSRMAELQQAMPANMEYTITSDAAIFAKISIQKVVITLLEAMLLVFLVMYLFLQKIRYTLIPAIVAPIALLGTFAVMLVMGFSINVFTMFGMVLAIGIIVDDAIVVVENVERVMAETGLPPKAATEQAMSGIYSAVIGITAVLSAVFIPISFAAGSVGTIFQQFSLSMAVSILFSAFLALTLTPALCATLLKPLTESDHNKVGFFGWFNRSFAWFTAKVAAITAYLIQRTGRMMLLYLGFVAVCIYGFTQIPSTFLPEEDQGFFMTSVQLPSDATVERTMDVVTKIEEFALGREAVEASMSVLGFSFSGTGPSSAFGVTTLKGWDQRNGVSTQQEMQALNEHLSDLTEGQVFNVLPAAIDGLGNSSNLSLQLQDRSNLGYERFLDTQAEFLNQAYASGKFAFIYFETLPETSGIQLNIDRAKARALGVPFNAISETISTAMGSNYVNDFPNNGRLQQVIVQVQAQSRMQLEDILKLSIRNEQGGTVYLSQFVTPVWGTTPQQLTRFNGVSAVAVSASPAVGVSSGEAMQELERIVDALPSAATIEWTGLSLQEREAESQTVMLLLFSMLVIFLVLSALYESWTIPLAVILVVPLGVIGAVAFVMLNGMANDVFFKVGLVTIIGLSAKNAILIVEFAKQARKEGSSLIDSVLTATRLRLRPILMTSLAFSCGIIPLYLASGPSSEVQNSLGTGVLGGMFSGTVLAVLFVPVFFVFINQTIDRVRGRANKSGAVL
ncbi:multidrug efflux RND transporter permease subunit [Shewanella eurypsychrophilus]|uniref:Efflux pump membrane transporter n=1 Tax=Shewanella eurypsychrophilus TaxID=2593656 RepID=A0ABX6V8P4_9GAMM|nr:MULTISPECIES: multidrug efflux RND transporter permease subunit [Shewanella]QFU23773.1 multidrug efflux RND transporter permease subunit [Shewanella sp. YLB-09]QPG58996.1 multidrug efflux RND transporter permease subunit [Shewanella eurypsychrophilus]